MIMVLGHYFLQQKAFEIVPNHSVFHNVFQEGPLTSVRGGILYFYLIVGEMETLL